MHINLGHLVCCICFTDSVLITEIFSIITKDCCKDKDSPTRTYVFVCLLLFRKGTARLMDLSKSVCEKQAVEVVATSGTKH
jgi:hypothetical protein